jgi:hypothetical protein
MRILTMPRRIAVLVPVLAAAVLAVAGCGGGDRSGSGPASKSAGAGASVAPSVAPSNAPSGAGSGSAGSPGAAGAAGADNGDANGSGGGGSGGGGSSTGALPAPNGNTGLGSLPAGFPLPDGTMLGRIAVRSTDITAPMEVPDGARAAAFWKKQLPVAGYKISSAVVVKEIGEIKFSGNGCKRGSDLAISGEHVAFLCRR